MVQKRHTSPFTLGIDIGGTGIKMLVMDANGHPVTPYIYELTPKPATVKALCQVMILMIKSLKFKFQRVSAGFPGVVIDGVIKNAYNLDASWIGINLEKKLSRLIGFPTRAANDTDIQGYGAVTGEGVELVITLGTGLGSALFVDGKLVPNLQLAHIPFRENKTYEQFLGSTAFKKNGIKKWNDNLKKAIVLWAKTFNYNKLYLGSGHAQKINFKLPPSAHLFNNVDGILGGIKLWK